MSFTLCILESMDCFQKRKLYEYLVQLEENFHQEMAPYKEAVKTRNKLTIFTFKALVIGKELWSETNR